MAVNENESSTGRSLAIGLNVLLMVVLAVALVAGLQWIGYSYSARADLTTSGTNSLANGTRKMLSELDRNIRITSLYYEFDLEGEDQPRYRKAVEDLLDLYQATNRSKVAADCVNPLQDHEKRKALINRLSKIEQFAEQTKGYREAVDAFTQQIVPAVSALMTDELGRINALGTLSDDDNRIISQVKLLYERTHTDLQTGSREITDALASEVPAYSAATTAIRRIYSQVSQMLESVIGVSEQLKVAGDKFSPAVVAFFADAESRYRTLIDMIKSQQDGLGQLPRLELDDLLRSLGPKSNAVVVETENDARVIDFRDLWPSGGSGPAGENMAPVFAGEQKLTAAILQLTQESKPAVMFVRYGGPPLLMGGFMPGQPQVPYGQMRQRLEEVNFSVHEWDLASQETQPEIDPTPSRVIYLVLPPNPPPRGPMGQPSQQPPFSDEHLQRLVTAMGESPRAMFLAGFELGQFGTASTYAYNEYLKGNWGVESVDDRLLLRLEPIGIEKYGFGHNLNPIMMSEFTFSDHPIVNELGRMMTNLPIAAPIELLDENPEGVTVERLAWMERTEGLWAIKDIQHYQRQTRSEFIVRGPEDYEDEFAVAVAGTRGDAKMILIGSQEFSTDRMALLPRLVLTSQGFEPRLVNPGNVTLLINSLHWLNDNTEWMNLGAPIDPATINIDRNSSQMTFVKAVAYVIWPGMFFLTGVVVWWTRRS